MRSELSQQIISVYRSQVETAIGSESLYFMATWRVCVVDGQIYRQDEDDHRAHPSIGLLPPRITRARLTQWLDNLFRYSQSAGYGSEAVTEERRSHLRATFAAAHTDDERILFEMLNEVCTDIELAAWTEAQRDPTWIREDVEHVLAVLNAQAPSGVSYRWAETWPERLARLAIRQSARLDGTYRVPLWGREVVCRPVTLYAFGRHIRREFAEVLARDGWDDPWNDGMDEADGNAYLLDGDSVLSNQSEWLARHFLFAHVGTRIEPYLADDGEVLHVVEDEIRWTAWIGGGVALMEAPPAQVAALFDWANAGGVEEVEKVEEVEVEEEDSESRGRGQSLLSTGDLDQDANVYDRESGRLMVKVGQHSDHL